MDAPYGNHLFSCARMEPRRIQSKFSSPSSSFPCFFKMEKQLYSSSLSCLLIRASHFVPLRIESHTLQIPFQRGESPLLATGWGRPTSSLMYLLRNTFTHSALGRVNIPHPSFIRKASLFWLILRMPKPPLTFGWQTRSHLTRWGFFFSFVDPQIKDLLWASISSQVNVGSLTVCIVYVGRAEMTDWVRVIRPAKESWLVFHPLNLSRTLSTMYF